MYAVLGKQIMISVINSQIILFTLLQITICTSSTADVEYYNSRIYDGMQPMYNTFKETFLSSDTAQNFGFRGYSPNMGLRTEDFSLPLRPDAIKL